MSRGKLKKVPRPGGRKARAGGAIVRMAVRRISRIVALALVVGPLLVVLVRLVESTLPLALAYIASLLLARAVQRKREIAVRLAGAPAMTPS